MLPLDSVAPLDEEGPHNLCKVGRLDEGAEVHDGGDGGKDPDTDVERFQTDYVVLSTATFWKEGANVINNLSSYSRSVL